jgi:dTDP-4-amino-4,6-dideoxygalactose transaminase
MLIPRVRFEFLSLDGPEVKSALEKNQLVVGPHIEEFESRLAYLFNYRYAVAVANGFASLFLSIKSMRLKNNRIIIPSVSTCFAMVNAVLASGNKPVFCDIDPQTLNLDINCVGELCQNNEVALIIAPSHFGIPAHINELRCFGVPIIEDACQSFHTRIKHRSNADMMILSFYPTKSLNTIEGGVILCNDLEVVKEIKDIRYYDKQNINDGKMRFNLRMTNITAAIGLSQLRKVENQCNQLLEIKKHYSFLRKQLADHFFENQFEPGIIPWRLLMKISNPHIVNSINQAGIEFSRELVYCGLNSPSQSMHNLIESVYSIPFYGELSEEEFSIINNTLLIYV